MTRQEQRDEIRMLADQNRLLKSILRSNLTPEEKVRAMRIGRLEYKSAGAVRKPIDPDRPF